MITINVSYCNISEAYTKFFFKYVHAYTYVDNILAFIIKNNILAFHKSKTNNNKSYFCKLMDQKLYKV